MKKRILSIAAVLTLSIGAMAQPDFNFETWANVPFSTTVQDPQGWASLNALTLVGTPQSTFKETIAPYAGAASCKITTVKVVGASIPNPFRPGKNFDTAGFVGVGSIVSVPSPSIKFGYSVSGRPATLSFACKYTPVAGDSAFVSAYLTHWNTGLSKRDTIASGQYATGVATTSYSVNSLTMYYKLAFSTVWADTMLVFASSSIYSHDGAKIGSTFWVDNFSWSGYNSVNDINGIDNKVSVFPNPASSVVNFQSSVSADAVEILDITGRKVGSYLMTANNVAVSTFDFAPGIYMYTVLNTKREVINRGKFEVTK